MSILTRTGILFREVVVVAVAVIVVVAVVGDVLVVSAKMLEGEGISSHCFCVWCESRELRIKGSSRSPCVNSVVETSSDRVTFRIPSNINDRAPLRKQPTGLTRWLFPQRSSTADLQLDSTCGSD